LNEEMTTPPEAQRLGQTFVHTTPAEAAGDAPLRAELFSAAQMAVHGRQLAARHQLGYSKGPDRLLARLADNAAVIAHAVAALTRSAKDGGRLTPAAEWLLDNYYLIEEQIRTARRHMPKDYSSELPRLNEPGGTPRVYRLALELIAHGDGKLEPESLARFVAAYQEGAPLKLGELWAIPIMLRLALIENLRRIAANLEQNRAQRDLANGWADRMVETADSRPGDLILLVADMARSVQPMSASIVAELTRRLQGQSGALTQALQWIATRLADEGQTIDQQVQADIGRQAAGQVSISNSIGSLRLLGTTDWREFVETMSAVEQTLRLDPAGTYGKMNFATRDHYRHVIERLARQCDHTEIEVAAEALALAGEPRAPGDGGLDPRRRHVGYYLVGSGLPALERRLKPRCAGHAAPGSQGRAAAGLARRDRPVHLAVHRRRRDPRARRRHRGGLAGTARDPGGVRLQPARAGAGEPDGDPDRRPRALAAHGFQRRHSIRRAYHGGGALAPVQQRQRRRAVRGA
jgi:cyclic beta-1,2-glucan synthetase